MAFALGAAHTTHCARAALQALPSPFPDVASAKFAGLKTPAGGLACAAMIEIPQDAPGSVACGLPLLAICPAGHRRTIPFRLLKTGPDDRTPLYGRPFKCRACGSREVTLFDMGSQAELDAVQATLPKPDEPARAPS
jgi:hypothetical protein